MRTFQIESEKRYRLIFDPHAYVFVCDRAVLLYNSLSGRALVSFGTPRISLRVTSWTSNRRADVIELSGQELCEDSEYREFVQTVREELIADVVEVNESCVPPFQFPRIAEKEETFPDMTRNVTSAGERALRKLNIYLNGDCGQRCKFCESAYRQFPCCGMFEAGQDLDAKHLECILGWASGRSVSLAFLGGNVFYYPHLALLAKLLTIRPSSLPVEFYAHCLNVLANKERLAALSEWGAVLRVLVPQETPNRVVETVHNATRAARVSARFDFILEKNEDYRRASRLAKKIGIEKFAFRPFYNGQNRKYFEKYVFLSAEDILVNKPSLVVIRANSLLNRSAFGTLFVSSSGTFYSNAVSEPLGNVAEYSVAEAASKELADGHVWKRTRGQVEPCRACVFQNLCPPITGYEDALGRNNLCNVLNAHPGKRLIVLNAPLQNN